MGNDAAPDGGDLVWGRLGGLVDVASVGARLGPVKDDAFLVIPELPPDVHAALHLFSILSIVILTLAIVGVAIGKW